MHCSKASCKTGTAATNGDTGRVNARSHALAYPVHPHIAFLQRPCCPVDRAALIQAALSPRSLRIGQVWAPQTCCAAAQRYELLNNLLISELAVILCYLMAVTKE